MESNGGDGTETVGISSGFVGNSSSGSKSRWNKTKYMNSVVQKIFLDNSFRFDNKDASDIDDDDAKENDEEKGARNSKNKKNKKSSSCCKRTWGIIFNVCTSHFGLFVLMVLYTLIGAAVFHGIESNRNGLSDQEIATNIKNDILGAILLNTSCAVYSTNRSVLESEMLYMLDQYEIRLKENNLLKISESAKVKWDFPGSVLFCLTVCSTIGYGHIAPATVLGRWITILYGLFGIPLCLTMLADIGVAVTNLIKLIYKKLKKCYKRERERNKTNPLNYTPRLEDLDTPVNDSSDTVPNLSLHQVAQEVISQRRAHIEAQKDPDVSVLVPISITLLYALLGSIMYMLLENWTFTEAFYFIFISLSTIGFGDIYPGKRQFFLASWIYLIFGLSLLAMILGFIVDATNSTLSKAKDKVDLIAEEKLGIKERPEHVLKPIDVKNHIKSKNSEQEQDTAGQSNNVKSKH